MKHFLLILALFLPISSFAQESATVNDTLERKYRIRADFREYKEKKVPIWMELQVTNRGTKPLEEVWFVVYPNRFKKPLPGLNDLNYRRVYSNGFSPGGITWKSLHLASGQSVPPEVIYGKGLPLDPEARFPGVDR